MTPPDTLVVERTASSTLVATMDRPSTRNALSADLVEALLQTIDEAERTAVTTLVLRGTTTAFSSGFDLAELDHETDASLLMRFARIGILLERISAAPFMVVAVVEGPAVGAGGDLVLACDHRLATHKAGLRFPGAGFGVVLGTYRLVELLGDATAFELAAGRSLGAADAERMGLVSLRAVDELEASVSGICQRLEDLGLPTVKALKTAGRRHDDGEALAALVRSIAGRPGLKQRIVDFIDSTRPPVAHVS